LALFKAYFQDRQDVSDETVLLDIAEAQGFDRDGAAACIASELLTQAVRAEQQQWIDQNITSVPAILFDQKFMVPGAQSTEVFADVITKVLAKRGS
jgi:predicted DsbA family dithiol-disulfide isomerase